MALSPIPFQAAASPAPRIASPVARLVRAAARGDDRAWEQLVRVAGPAVRRAAAGFKLTGADLDDVAQITWVRAYERIGTLRDPEAFIGWVVVTARREALRLLQRHAREVLCDDERFFDGPGGPAPGDSLVDGERADAVRGAVERLPERQRRLLQWMLTHPGAGYAELSASLEMPIGSIGPTRERALARLRRDERLVAATA
jgi:RNA polymerase sigma factor (sigma-70 family)